MSHKKIIISMLLGCVLFTATATTIAFAVQITGLYRGDVPVASSSSQSPQLRTAALKQALQQVFIKVSGDSSVANIDNIQSAINNPNIYLQAYGYVANTTPSSPNGSALMLQAQFAPGAINKLLLQNNETIWGSDRPLVLVWLAVKTQNNNNISLISSEDPTEKLFAQDAKVRGLPILFPILDLTDMQALTVNEIWNPNPAMIRQASKRYGSDAILTASISQGADSQWQAHWMLLSQGNQTVWDDTAATLPTLLNDGINAVSDTLAARYGTLVTQSGTAQSGSQNELQLTVVNIENLADYAKVSRYLRLLTPVKRLEILQVNANSISYDLQVTGGRFALQQALSLDHRLQPFTVAKTDDVIANALAKESEGLSYLAPVNMIDSNLLDNGSDNGLIYQWQLNR